MVGGDGVAEKTQAAGALDITDGADGHRHSIEVGRVLDVGRGIAPGKRSAVRGLDLVPAAVALEYVGVVLLEQFRTDGPRDEVADFLVGRPDV